MIPEDIQKGIDITIEVLQRRYPNFNPNKDTTYSGLCNDASNVFIQAMENITGIKGKMIHGEIKHNSNVLSQYWEVEHTWVKYDKYYVDITCGQFRNIISNVPSIYVSKRPPKWFLPDSKNLYLIVYKIQYKWKGSISDFIYKAKNKGGN